MAWDIEHAGSIGADLVAVITNSAGEFWDGNSWEAGEQRLALTESGDYPGKFEYEVDGMDDEGLVKVSILDEGDNDRFQGGGHAWIYNGVEVVIATDTSGAGLATAAKLLKYIQLLARSDSAIATDNATELTAINADGGSGTGDYAGTTDSLEALANGSASTTMTILPLATTMATDALSNYYLTVGQYAGKSWTLAVYDSTGAAVNLSGKTIKVAVWRESAPSSIVVSLTGTVGGASNNQVTFAITGTNTQTVEVYRYTMRNITDDTDLIEGTITVNAAPDIT